MRFNFVLWNHGELGQRSLEDVIGLIGHQLRALGHEAIWVPGGKEFIKAQDGYNVIVEGFVPATITEMARLHGEGCRFLCIATEEPTPTGFNHGLPFEMIGRQECFPQAAKYLDGILHTIPGDPVAQWYGQFAPTAFLDLGYSPTLHGMMRRKAPKFDFGFYGSLSPRRKKILEKLAKKSGSDIQLCCNFATQIERDEVMRSCKIILQIRKFEQMDLISNCRCAWSLQLGCAVIGEPHANPGAWGDVIHLSKSLDAFYADAMAARNLWGGIHAAQYRKMKDTLTPETCVGQALERIGILNGERLRLAS